VASGTRIGVLASAGGFAALLLLVAGFQLGERRPGPELAVYMSQLQHHTHKLNLSIEAENEVLADFYLDEVEEVAEEIARLFPRYDGQPVAELARALLEPRLTALRRALAGSSWEGARAGFADVIAACNQCHATAAHEFIHIEVTSANPFNQSFAPE